jgi:hypothetical protein
MSNQSESMRRQTVDEVSNGSHPEGSFFVVKYLTAVICLSTLYLFSKTIFIPVLRLSFFSDDYHYLNWVASLSFKGWLSDFVGEGLYNISYRPMALVVYLFYLIDNSTVCYVFLILFCGVNSTLLFFLYRNVSNSAVAGLSILLFTASFIYYDATHAIYNLTTQASILFFLVSVHLFLSARASSSRRRLLSILSLCSYTLSVLTYEVTILGFWVVFILAFRDQYEVEISPGKLKRAMYRAVGSSWLFLLVSLLYIAVTTWSPIKANHLREHAVSMKIASIPVLLVNAWHILKYSLSWIITVDRGQAMLAYLSAETVIMGVLLAAVMAFLISMSPQSDCKGDELTSRRLLWLIFFGTFWFVVFLLPGMVATYFDYRLTYLAYAGFALVLASGLVLVYGSAIRLTKLANPFARRITAGILASIATMWVISNVSLVEVLNRARSSALPQERQLLSLVGPFLDRVPEEAVIAIRYDHKPLWSVPYPYFTSPFYEDHGLKNALFYYFGKKVTSVSLFFQPFENSFVVGRIASDQKSYPYNRLVLFDFIGNKLVLKTNFRLGEREIVLPLTQVVACPPDC